MSSFFNFKSNIEAARKKREKEAGLEQPAMPAAETNPVQPSMTQADFLYGPEGVRKKKPGDK